ncbi:MAG: sulfatase-like hydrolase/transferase [Bryobacteraceae bacterium]
MALPSSQTRVGMRDFLLCVSLGNLLFLRQWYDVVTSHLSSTDYYRNEPARHTAFWATLAAVGLTAVFLWLVSRLIRHPLNGYDSAGRMKASGRIAMMLMMIVSLETVRRFWSYRQGRVDWGSTIFVGLMEALLAWGIVDLFRNRQRVYRAAERALLFTTLVLPASAGHYWINYELTDPPAAWAERPTLPELPAKSGGAGASRRVIWLLFDEFDQRLAFDHRPSEVELPELDRLRAESMVAEQVEQTADFTLLAVPSLISGRIFGRSEPSDHSTLLLTPRGSTRTVNWHDQPNVFRAARELGFNTGIVGWHHPYCRVLGDSVTRCAEIPSLAIGNALARDQQAARLGFSRAVALAFHLRWMRFTDIFRFSGASAEHESEVFQQAEQQRQYFQIRDRAYRDAVDPRLGLVYIHFPTPHLFAIYDAKQKAFNLSEKTTYLDNLALVDRTVGELRRRLEEAGLWETTTLLVSSDHGLRREVWQGSRNWSAEFDHLLFQRQNRLVPFILKLAGQKEHITFAPRFSAVITGNLLLSVLNGEVSTSRDAAGWLASHGDATILSAR